ncbi:hypothetical protein VZT92_005822 [Zoarces viviparus]|uniref:Uncharacterized protein n=1 Tax=Zoarces viviparus TaxID=48416 RepID=A0AAW1FMD8_ZOAVI
MPPPAAPGLQLLPAAAAPDPVAGWFPASEEQHREVQSGAERVKHCRKEAQLKQNVAYNAEHSFLQWIVHCSH